jgi:cell shape-determining protein MreC
MFLPKSMTFAATPKTLVGISVAMLVLAAVFGLLNSIKVKGLHADWANTIAARDAAERGRIAQAKEPKSPQTNVPASAKVLDAESKAAKAETDLAKVQKEKADLQTRLEANQAEIASLQKRLEEAESKPAEASPGAPSTVELQAQLNDARRQLDSAERDKVFLSEKIRTIQERSTQLEEEKERRAAAGKAGVRGTVLAVNQAYNFVVLNLGSRQGVEPNSEMLVVRDGTLIGKIRISSVEPITAIGDIIISSLARGVRVQPGDIVIYAGTNS